MTLAGLPLPKIAAVILLTSGILTITLAAPGPNPNIVFASSIKEVANDTTKQVVKDVSPAKRDYQKQVVKGVSKTQTRFIKLTDVVRRTLAFHFDDSPDKGTLKQFAESLDSGVPDIYKKPAGVFVTLSRKGKTRACWGSVTPQYPDLILATIYATEGALNKEYRFASIDKHELSFLKPQVTVVRALEPVGSFRELNPVLHGLMVRSGGKAAVLLPGEAVDPYYQMIQCKLKAGINPKSSCQLYRMKCNVFQ